ncbi:hypothetical protein ACFOON_17240 [Novosphingobium piscinae]|uniref:Uncharacterized protein n=1 Tax=Novosphingobium piscinae TaxID=1507448 RepID=A0A7X1G1L0_9SPHN|nr:hypothetical protein [Novosphingobium piscinae]MBC2670322.1 hypothetical protein [Novosphingobium piscinae]
MRRAAALAALLRLATAPAGAAGETFDPARVSEVDAIACHLTAPEYNGFALAVDGEDGIAVQRHWRRIETDNPFLAEYELPAPITVAGQSTRRIAFSSSAILAVLDLADPAVVAGPEGVANAADPEGLIAGLVQAGRATRAEIEAGRPFRKFLGQKVLTDVTEPATDGASFGTHTVIARSISNVSSHPGKTLYGCSYRIDLIDRTGKRL